MPQRFSRRQLLQNSALAGAGLCLPCHLVNAKEESPNEKLNIAVIGVGGRGAANLGGVASQNIVALCDVDDHRADKAYERFPKAKKFHDFRRMLDRMENQIDAVVVSTPDHTHAHPSLMAMEMGKHLYCEKPMAHAVAEVRAMTDLAAKKKLATQLGVQRHALSNVHRVVELIWDGVIGKVDEVHAWIGGDRGMPSQPEDFPPVPEHLKWDLWLGPAADRRYSPAYVPYKWRFWWDFGTGETGNWGCHILDIPFWALDLKYPTHVSGSGPEVDPLRTPKSMATHFDFPGSGDRDPVKLHWYHTKSGPEVLQQRGLPKLRSGVLFIGSEGMLLCDFGKRVLYPLDKFKDYEEPEPSIPDSPGFHNEWINACKGGPPATCHFGYSGPLTETVLLGNVAYRAGKAFHWKADALEAVDCPAADPLLRPTYRDGWPLP